MIHLNPKIKIIKAILTFLNLISFTMLLSAQTTFRSENKTYKSNNYVCEFIMFDDSTCFIRKYYKNNFSKYSLYKGKLKKKTSINYELSFQPVVEFGCNKRLHWRKDSIRFNIRQHNLTSFPMNFDVSIKNGNKETIEIRNYETTIFLKGAGKNSFTMNTGFIDPLTNKKVIMTIEPHSEPDLSYYKNDGEIDKLNISIAGDLLTIHPDKKQRWKKDIFARIK